MNKKKVNAVIQQYIDRFYEFDDVKGNDEGYKWRAVSNFKKYWDIEAEDFADMFTNSVKRFKNLVGEGPVYPLEAIKKLFEYKETEFVREQFRKLFYEDDGGNLNKRQDRTDCFVEAINNKIEEHISSKIYRVSRRTAIFFLNAYCPEDNFIYKATEALNWAADMCFAEDIGGGMNFSLEKYYRMCRETLEIMKGNDELVALILMRCQREAVGFDDKLHIAVFDLIYCYDTYMVSEYDKGLTVKQKQEKKQVESYIDNLKQERKALNDDIEKIEIEAQALNSAIAEKEQFISDVVGCAAQHKTLGEGVIISVNISPNSGLVHKIQFGDTIKAFQCSISYGKGILSIGNADKDKAISELACLYIDKHKNDVALNKLLGQIKTINDKIESASAQYHIATED